MADIDIGDIIRQISGGLKSAAYKGPMEQVAESRREEEEYRKKSGRKDIEDIKAEEIAKRMEGVKSEHAVRLAQAGDPGMLQRLELTEAGLGKRLETTEAGSLARENIASKTHLGVADITAKGGQDVAKTYAQAQENVARTAAGPKENIFMAGMKAGMPLKDVKEYATAMGGGPQDAGGVIPSAGTVPAAAAGEGVPRTPAQAPGVTPSTGGTARGLLSTAMQMGKTALGALPLGMGAAFAPGPTARATLAVPTAPTAPARATGKSMAGFYPSLLSSEAAAQGRTTGLAKETAQAQKTRAEQLKRQKKNREEAGY